MQQAQTATQPAPAAAGNGSAVTAVGAAVDSVPQPGTERPPHPLHGAGLGDRHGAVLRLRLRHPEGRARRPARLHDRRRRGVHGDARPGRNGGAASGLRVLRPVREPLSGAAGRLRDRLDVRLRDGDRGHRGRHGLQHLHGILVPRRGALGLDPGHHLLPGGPEPAQRQGLRRAGVLVLADQGGGHHRHDRGRRGDHRLRLPDRRRHRGARAGQPRGARGPVPQRVRRAPGLLRGGDVRLRRGGDPRHHRR